MPTSSGPNILGENNLVFAYDTGDVKNSYIGEPTVNITSGTITPYTPYNTLVRNGQNFTLTMVPGSAKYLTLHNGTDYVGQTLSYSGYMYKNGVPFNPLSTSTVPTTYQSSSGISNQFYNPETGYFKFTLYFNASSIWLFHQPVGAADNDIIQINNLQIEVKNHTTPFTTGTRSATQGLLPLVGNSTLDLSNVSFDSNAQIVFDGTDDTISVTSYPAIELVDNVSIECIYKRLSTDPVLDIIANKYNSGTGWELFCQTGNTFALAGRNGDGTYYVTTNAAYTIQNNKYYHLVAMKEGLSWRLYVNGELYAYLTANSVGTWSNTGILQIGGEDGGYYPNMELPVFKIYNRALSAGEVRQNYQQYKTRFNLS